jgi:hypothetical protein
MPSLSYCLDLQPRITHSINYSLTGRSDVRKCSIAQVQNAASYVRTVIVNPYHDTFAIRGIGDTNFRPEGQRLTRCS